MNTNTELKRNFLVSVVLHAAVLVCIILVTAFAPAPRIDTTIMMDIGGPGAGGGGEETPPPPAPAVKESTPPPAPAAKEVPEPEKLVPAKREEPKQADVVIPKETPKKKVQEKKIEPPKEPVKKAEPKKAETKPKVEVSKKLVKKGEVTNSTSKKPAKPDPRYSASAIRDRLGKATNVRVGPVGSGPGTTAGPGGGGSQFGEYYSMLSSILYEAWDTPGTATPSMSTVVRVRISNDGALSFISVVRKSGSDIMDESVISAVIKTKRVPPPPAGLGNSPELSITFQPDGA